MILFGLIVRFIIVRVESIISLLMKVRVLLIYVIQMSMNNFIFYIYIYIAINNYRKHMSHKISQRCVLVQNTENCRYKYLHFKIKIRDAS